MGEFTAVPDRPLPDPRQEGPVSAHGSLLRADRAAWRVRRLMDSSRCLLTGNMAFLCCLPATIMSSWSLVEADWARILGALVLFIAEFGIVVSFLRMGRLRAMAGLEVVDRVEVNLKEFGKIPNRRRVGFLTLYVAYMILCTILFTKVLPFWGMIAGMWLGAAFMAGFFVRRFVLFQFWEDLLFAASILMAWSLFLSQLRTEYMKILVLMPPLEVLVGTTFLYMRWREWARSFPISEATIKVQL